MQVLLTAQEVAEVLRISPRRLEQMVADGTAPQHCRIGRLRRWRADDLDEWLTDHLWTGTSSQRQTAEEEEE